MSAWRRIRRATPPRAWAWLAGLLVLLLLAPLGLDRYGLSVFFLIFWFAFVGQAWNVMMGLCGQLSLGHALYVGLGGYMAAYLWVGFGVPPMVSVVPAVLAAALVGLAIGWLGLRFGIEGVYFALLTLAFAEVARIGFDNWPLVGGAAGLFIPVRATDSWVNLRGGPLVFYYGMLALAAGAFVLCAALRTSRMGQAWVAVREDPEAARALGINVFQAKLSAILVSSGLTAIGGIVYAFYQGSLFPSQAFDIARSIEIILGPIIGGLGTLFGPILGAFILTPLGQGLIALVEHLAGHPVPGANLVAYGLALMVMISLAPNGLWPLLRRRLGLEGRGRGPGSP